jgi:hypothetical protein
MCCVSWLGSAGLVVLGLVGGYLGKTLENHRTDRRERDDRQREIINAVRAAVYELCRAAQMRVQRRFFDGKWTGLKGSGDEDWLEIDRVNRPIAHQRSAEIDDQELREMVNPILALVSGAMHPDPLIATPARDELMAAFEKFDERAGEVLRGL